MATRFEIVLHGENEIAMRAAAEEAFQEIESIEAQLSLFRPTSEVSHLNTRAAHEPVRVTPPLFSLLKQARDLSEKTNGAFDITVAPLVRCWGFLERAGRIPTPEEIAQARALVGWKNISLDETNFTVRFLREGVMLDFGAIGKGYAIERAANLLREAGMTSGILHGGTSTIYASGKPVDAETWKIGIEKPPEKNSPQVRARNESPQLLTTISLCDEALSVSAISGKTFDADGKTFGHVIDPRTGQPVSETLLAAVALPSATETDALSTALLTLGASGTELLAELFPHARSFLFSKSSVEKNFETSSL